MPQKPTYEQLEHELNQIKRQLGERIKEQNCLHEFTLLVERPGITLEELLQNLVKLIPPAWQYPQKTCARITFNDNEYSTASFHQTDNQQYAEIIVKGETEGQIQVFRFDQSPDEDELFLPEKQTLLDMIAERLGRIIERLQEEEELKKREEALRESEELLRAAAQASLDSLFICRCYYDENGEIIDFIFDYINTNAAEMLQMKPEEIVGKRMCELLPVNRTEKFFEKYKRVFETGAPLEEEFYLPETHVPASWYYHQVVKISDGIVISHRDISERKRGEEELRIERELSQRIIEDGPVAITLLDRDGQIVFANRHAEHLLGLDKSTIGALTYNAPEWIITDVDGSPFPDERLPFRRVMSTGKPVYKVHHAITMPDASRKILSINGAPLHDEQGRIDRAVFAILDITERIEREKALHDERQRLSLVIDGSRLGTWEWNVQTNETVFNETWAAMLGYTLEELTPYNIETWKQLTHPDDLAHAQELLVSCVEGKTPDYECELRMKHKDGHWVWMLDTGRVMTHDDDGKALSMFGTHRDITERKQAEQEMRKSEEKWRSYIQNAPFGVFITDGEGRYLDVNPAACEITGYAEEELLTMSISDLIPTGSEQETLSHFQRLRDTGFSSGDAGLLRKDGQVRQWSVSAVKLSENRFLGFAEDITERKQAEEALRESENRIRTKLNTLLNPEGDIGTLHLADVVDCDEIQSLMNDFYALTDIGVGILDQDGNILVGIGYQDVCTKFHRVHPETAKRCWESDTQLVSGVEPGTFKIYKCKNNMWDMVTPIMIGGKHLGNLFLGQFFFEDETPDIAVFREQARRYGFDEDAYLKAYNAIPRWSRETVDRVMTFYCNLINFITRLSYAHIKLARTAEALRKSELLFQAMLDAIPDMISVHDNDMNIVYSNWNGFAAAPPDRRILGEKCYRIYRGLDKVCPDCRAKQVIETRKSYREVVEVPEGVWLELNVIPILDAGGNCELFVEWVRDITDRKKSEETLKQSEEKIRALVENTIDWNWQTDANGKYTYSSENTDVLIGYTKDEIIGETPFDFMDNDEAHRVLNIFKEIAKKNDRIVGLEDTFLHKDGHPVIFETNATPLIDKKGNLLGYFGTCRDITERKFAEVERERLKIAIEQSGEIIVITGAEGDIQYVNPVFERITGYTLQEVIGQNPRILKSGKQSDEYYRELWDTISSGETWQGRLVNKRKDGSLYTEDATISPVYNADREIVNYVAVKKDVTEQLTLEGQYQQAQKMESVGRLAGGVAHDFNNMLSVISGNAEFALNSIDTSHPIYTEITEIQSAAQRSADLTRQLLAFARKQTVTPKALNLNNTIKSMLKMLGRLIGEDIDLLWMPGKKLDTVYIDPAQIDQLLANLAVNARDAIGQNVGKITIETDNVDFDEEYCTQHTGFIPGLYIMLAVSDDGCGMDAETKAQVFEPFFTTKGQGEGTGLGLATVYGIIKQNQGFVNIYSELGEGTTLKIYFPAHVSPTTEETKKHQAKPVTPGHETILLVEDEPSILSLGKKILERLGYQIIAASTPVEAIRLAKEHNGRIDLLMTDVIMPEMNGRDLAKRIMTLYPDIKRLFTSGYTANVIAHHGVLDEGVNFIEKPFSINDLSEKVRKVLNKG